MREYKLSKEEERRRKGVVGKVEGSLEKREDRRRNLQRVVVRGGRYLKGGAGWIEKGSRAGSPRKIIHELVSNGWLAGKKLPASTEISISVVGRVVSTRVRYTTRRIAVASIRRPYLRSLLPLLIFYLFPRGQASNYEELRGSGAWTGGN